MTKPSLRFSELILAYYACHEFRNLKSSTKYVRRGILERLMREHVAPGNPLTVAQLPAALTPKVIRVLRDRHDSTPESANNTLKALRAMYKWAIEADHVAANPARDVPYIKNKTAGYHTWTDEEVLAYEARWPLGTCQRVALAVLLYTGLRRSDAVRAGWPMVLDDVLSLYTVKGNTLVEIPVIEDLKEVLAIGPIGKTTWITGQKGGSVQADSFGPMFHEWSVAAGLKNCSAHGLRKAGACRAAERGATEQQLMAIFGWQTSKEATLYTRAANRRSMASQAGKFLGKSQIRTERIVSPIQAIDIAANPLPVTGKGFASNYLISINKK